MLHYHHQSSEVIVTGGCHLFSSHSSRLLSARRPTSKYDNGERLKCAVKRRLLVLRFLLLWRLQEAGCVALTCSPSKRIMSLIASKMNGMGDQRFSLLPHNELLSFQQKKSCEAFLAFLISSPSRLILYEKR